MTPFPIRATLKSLVQAVLWVVATPFLAMPHFVVMAWLLTVLPGTGASFDSASEMLKGALALSYFSILILPFTALFIGFGANLLMARAKLKMSGFWCVTLCAILVGWCHCISYLILTETGLLKLNFWN